MPKTQHPWRCSYQVRIRKEYESRPSQNRPCIPSKKPSLHEPIARSWLPLTTVSNFINARWRDWHCPELNCSRIIPALEQGLSAPSAKANKPATLYQHSQLPIPRWGSHRPCSLPYMRRRMHPHARNRAHPQAHPHAPATTRTRTHSATNAHSHAGREGHSRMRRWVQRHRGDESEGYQRREHQSDDHDPLQTQTQAPA